MENAPATIISQRRSGSTAYADMIKDNTRGIVSGEALFNHRFLNRTLEFKPVFRCDPDLFLEYLSTYWMHHYEGRAVIHKFPVLQWHPSVYTTYARFIRDHGYHAYLTTRDIDGRFISQLMRLANQAEYTYMTGEDHGIDWKLPDPSKKVVRKAAQFVAREETYTNMMKQILYARNVPTTFVRYERDILPISDQISTKYAILHDRYPDTDMSPYIDVLNTEKTRFSVEDWMTRFVYDCDPYIGELVKNPIPLLQYDHETDTLIGNPTSCLYETAVSKQMSQ